MAVGDTFRFRGRTDRVLEELTLGRKKFQILERLGGGGRERYRAFDRLAGMKGDYRAIHVLPRTHETEQHLSVLQRIADLRNGNVPFLVEHYRRDDRVYLVLAWTWGRSLAEHLTRIRTGQEQPASAFQACRLIRGLTHGLCQLHHRWNVNHGDIKPENLILAPQGRGLSTIDFGTAWLAERTSRRLPGDGVSGVYSAPEILDGTSSPDFRSDQFSVSVVWYELLTRQIPYDGAGGKAGLATLRESFTGKFIPPSQLASAAANLPRHIWRLVDEAAKRGLSLNPSERFPDRRAWLDALDEIHLAARERKVLSRFNQWVVDLLSSRLARRRDAEPSRDF